MRIRLENFRAWPVAAIAAIVAVAAANPAHGQAPTAEPAPAPPADSAPTAPAPAAPVDAAPPAGAAALHGTVTAGDGRAPQAGATVTVVTTGAQTVTNDRGEYTLSVSPGTHTVRVEM